MTTYAEDPIAHFKECDCHDSWNQCPCAEGGHYPNCACCGDGICGPISGLTKQESDDFMQAVVTETGDEYAAKSVSVSWKGTPTADVSDLAIAEATAYAESGGYEHGLRIAAVRDLLDVQAAAHAAEVEAKGRALTEACIEIERHLQSIVALRAEVERWGEDSIRDRERAVKAEGDRDRLLDILNELGICPKDGESMPCMTCGAGL